jgi:hypothetical protein
VFRNDVFSHSFFVLFSFSSGVLSLLVWGRREVGEDGCGMGDEGSGREGGREEEEENGVRGREMKQRSRLHEEVSVGTTEVLLKTFDIKQDAYIFMYIFNRRKLNSLT